MRHAFHIVAGEPVLDFINTVHDWTIDEPRDYLPDFSEALRFGEAAGALTRGEVRALSATSSEAETRRLRELRSRLERVFRAATTGKAVPAEDLVQLGKDAASVAASARMQASHGGRRITRLLKADEAGPALLRLRLVDSAVALLASDHMDRVKSCPSCGWFFLDTTKNASRRWCSMDMCGSAAKASAYYWRRKKRRQKGRKPKA